MPSHTPPGPRLGAHQSIAGGLPQAVDRAVANGCDTLQIFTSSPSRWKARPLPDTEVAAFRARVTASGIGPVLTHVSYLVNVGAHDRAIRVRSIAALTAELERADALGLAGVVLHPGAFTGGTETAGLRRIADSLDRILERRHLARPKLLLEHTAGQGTALGHRFEHLALLLDRLGWTSRVGVCLDTCHLFAAGYDVRTPAAYAHTMAAFDAAVGIDRIAAIHLNDSRRALGSRVDRHEHIGRGAIGLEGFRCFLTDARLASVPMIIETPKSKTTGRPASQPDPCDLDNLSTLRGLLARGPSVTTAPP